MRFSERQGYQKTRDAIQIDSMDEALRNSLWTVLQVHVWNYVRHSTGMYAGYYLSCKNQALPGQSSSLRQGF